MKGFFLTVFVFLSSIYLHSQINVLPINSISGKIVFTDVIQIDNATSKELFYRAKQWLAKTYVSVKNVTQMEDIDQGTLMVKAIIPVYTTFAVKAKLGVVSYTFTISVKDNRYRYVISDLWHDTLYNTGPGSAINTPGDLTLEKPGG